MEGGDAPEVGGQTDASEEAELTRIYLAVAGGLQAAARFDLNAMGGFVAQLEDGPESGPAAEGRRILIAARDAFSAIAGLLSGSNEAMDAAADRLAMSAEALHQPYKDDTLERLASDLRPTATIWVKMVGGMAMVARGDLAGGMQVLDDVRRDPKGGRMVAELEPNLLFVTAAAARGTGGIDAARPLIQRAAASSENLATLYYQDNIPRREYALGQAAYYRAVLNWWEVVTALPRLALDEIADGETAVRQADLAIAHLEKSGDEFGNAPVLQASKVLRGLLAAGSGLAQVLRDVLASNFRVKDIEGLSQSRSMVRDVRDTAPGNLRSDCQTLEETISNVIRLHKPQRKDFGIVSGIVSCVLFVGLFAVIALIDLAFDLDVDPLVMLAYAAPLALIGGFGFGALRLARMLPGGPRGASQDT